MISCPLLISGIFVTINSPAYVGLETPMLCIFPYYQDNILVGWWRQKKSSQKAEAIWAFKYNRQTKRASMDRGIGRFYSAKTDHDRYHKLVLATPSTDDAGEYWCSAVVNEVEYQSERGILTVEGKGND